MDDARQGAAGAAARTVQQPRLAWGYACAGRLPKMPRNAAVVALVACWLLAAAPAAAASRQLHDFIPTETDTIASPGSNPLKSGTATFSQAREAEVRANSKALGIYHNEATRVAIAGDLLPGARHVAATHGGLTVAGGPMGAAVHAFGPSAMAITDTGVRAFAGSGAMQARPSDRAPSEVAIGSTTKVWQTPPTRATTGKTKDVQTDRRASLSAGFWGGGGGTELVLRNIGYTDPAPLSSGISGVGGGPIAIASANEAVAMSNADTQANEGRGIPN
ncbi:hypothetical protein Rsub_06563 [Raphidocelis subcapitata]|uniref:Uncharacterized protein n=1 Tax=Raphidocelis subcapitata TaxID=307507 RepID=A0A2V0P6F0_9CHLO|nr:hypothetical protein Rsub_06563 [Raphidocelis subcapitata]|eukprot:GBF93430.1 hypothetical protein Rsub_06563 [Raphidocelis subcapitata]